jgi:hypothetical protein
VKTGLGWGWIFDGRFNHPQKLNLSWEKGCFLYEKAGRQGD